MVSQQVKVVSIKKVPEIRNSHIEPTPGPSGVCRSNANAFNNDSLSRVSSEDEDDKYSVCGKFTPDAVRYSESEIFTKRVSCDGCNQWTHLIYCTNVRVVRHGDSFFCPHSSPEEWVLASHWVQWKFSMFIWVSLWPISWQYDFGCFENSFYIHVHNISSVFLWIVHKIE